MPDVEVTIQTTPIDVSVNTDPNIAVSVCGVGVQGPMAESGDYIHRSESGLFYPNANPSGFISENYIFGIGISGHHLSGNWTADTLLISGLSNGEGVSSSGAYSHAEGFYTSGYGNYSHAEGNYSYASGNLSHAEGDVTIAVGEASHSEGSNSVAIGYCSHAEGLETVTSGINSHAEGEGCKTIGEASHAEGLGTISSGNHQLALGKYNLPIDSSLMVVGNGSSNTARSNILTIEPTYLSVSGSGLFLGGLYLNFAPVATQQYTQDYVSGAVASGMITGSSTGALTGSYVTSGDLNQRINWISGQTQAFVTGIPTGIDSLNISFPSGFSNIPTVQITLEIPSGDENIYGLAIKNKTTTNFTALFSDVITETGYYLNIWASVLF